MKNCVPAEFGSLLRAIDRTPGDVRRVVEFRLDLVAAAAGAGAERAAALDHETVDDAVEDQIVVEADLGQGDEVLDVPRRDIGQELRAGSAPCVVSSSTV